MEMGELARSIDVDWVFAPVVDLDDGPAQRRDRRSQLRRRPGRGVRGGRRVRRRAARDRAGRHREALPGPRRFRRPPPRRAVDDSTLAELEAADLVPFGSLIDDGAEAVMVGHVAYPEIWGDQPASLVPGVYELLREQGFDGVAVTDALGHGSRPRPLRLRPGAGDGDRRRRRRRAGEPGPADRRPPPGPGRRRARRGGSTRRASTRRPAGCSPCGASRARAASALR